MQIVFTVAQMLVRITGVLQLILGLLIWAEGMRNLVTLHIYIGLLLVISLWVMAAAGARLGAPIGLAAALALVGLVVVWSGMTQASLLPGDLHWIVQIVHLLLGMAAVGMAEALGGRLRRIQLGPAQA